MVPHQPPTGQGSEVCRYARRDFCPRLKSLSVSRSSASPWLKSCRQAGHNGHHRRHVSPVIDERDIEALRDSNCSSIFRFGLGVSMIRPAQQTRHTCAEKTRPYGVALRSLPVCHGAALQHFVPGRPLYSKQCAIVSSRRRATIVSYFA